MFYVLLELALLVLELRVRASVAISSMIVSMISPSDCAALSSPSPLLANVSTSPASSAKQT